MLKKYAIAASAAAIVLSFAAVASFAAQPTNPGCIGAAVSGQAHEWDGRGEVVSSIAKTGAYGDGVKDYLATNPCGH